MSRPRLSLALLLAACGPAPLESGSSAISPGAGQDVADESCRVVLREVGRVGGGTGWETACTNGRCWFVWAGKLDVAKEAVAEGAEPWVLYRATWDARWHAARATPGAAGASFDGFELRLGEETIPAGTSGTSFARTVIELIPFLLYPSGGRAFDHNRVAGNYLLDSGNAWSIGPDGSCPAERPRAELSFRTGWQQQQHGAIVRGGRLVVHYALGRMPDCFGGSFHGRPDWNTIGWARFSPGDRVVNAPLVDVSSTGVGTDAVPRPMILDVPADATHVELWFLTSGRTCRTRWDSNFGRNYRFEVLPPGRVAAPAWAGNLGNRFNRACERQGGLAEPMIIDSWIRERACKGIDAEVWVPGGARHDEVAAKVRFSTDGGPAEEAWLAPAGRAGNNLRFEWDPSALLAHRQWGRIEWCFAFSTDGLVWRELEGGTRPIASEAPSDPAASGPGRGRLCQTGTRELLYR